LRPSLNLGSGGAKGSVISPQRLDVTPVVRRDSLPFYKGGVHVGLQK
jgi:hypothetical protein